MLEVSIIGVALLILAIFGGGWISDFLQYAEAWTFTPNQHDLRPHSQRFHRLRTAGVALAGPS